MSIKFLVSEVEKAYVAGLIDGEGHISILKHFHLKHNVHSFRLRVGLTNTDGDTVHWFNSIFGGKLISRKTKSYYKTRYDCTLYSAHAGKFLEEIFPYLKIKRQRAAIAIHFAKRRHLGMRSQLEKKQDFEDFDLFKQLNRRGDRAQE